MAATIGEAADAASIGLAGECVAAADRLLRRATDAVRAKVAPGGVVDPALLEREQHAVHGLAWLATHVEALRQMHAWALRLEGLGRLGELEQLILRTDRKGGVYGSA